MTSLNENLAPRALLRPDHLMRWTIQIASVIHRRSIRNAAIMIVVLWASVAAFFGPTDNWSWDPSFYYGMLRAPVVDHSLDIRHDVAVPAEYRKLRTATGLYPSVWPIGTSILWSPFFIAAHLYKLLFDAQNNANGWSPLYIAMVSAGSTLYGLLGVLVTFQICRRFSSCTLSLIAATLTLFASPLFFYVYRQPIMAHAPSFLVSATLLYICVQADFGPDSRWHRTTLIGVVLGLGAILRWISIVAVILPAVIWTWRIVEARRARMDITLRSIVAQVALAAAAALIVVSPQLVVLQKMYGQWLALPNSGFTQGYLPVHLLDLFIHSNRGVLYWAPFIVLGMLGLLLIEPLRLRVAVCAYMLAFLFVLAVWPDWYGGGGFGPRYFIEVLPFVALGFVSLAKRFWTDWRGKVAIVALALFLVVHQLILVTMVEQVWLPLEAYFTGGELGITYQLAAFMRLFQAPTDLLLARPYVGADRQTALISFISGIRSNTVYLIPVVAAIVVPLGVIAALLSRKSVSPKMLSAAIMVFMLSAKPLYISQAFLGNCSWLVWHVSVFANCPIVITHSSHD